MRKNRQQEIFDKYPKIFAQHSLPPSQTAMCWGLECGDGWLDLIDALCGDIQRYIDNNPEVTQIEATQVKQKFGSLRFYYSYYNKVIDELIWEACSRSAETCEQCGSNNNVTQTKGWISPLCEDCMYKYMKEKK